MQRTEVFMNTSTAKCVPLEGDLPTMAERELAAFTAAVNDLFGAEQARLAAEDWIRELGLAWEGGATVRDLRQITIQGGASLREPCQRADPIRQAKAEREQEAREQVRDAAQNYVPRKRGCPRKEEQEAHYREARSSAEEVVRGFGERNKMLPNRHPQISMTRLAACPL